MSRFAWCVIYVTAFSLTVPSPSPSAGQLKADEKDSTSADEGNPRNPDAFVTWARENAIPIESIDPNDGYDQLGPLAGLIGDARIVGLGESTHSSQEFYKAKRYLFQFLVEKIGFTAFAMETNFSEAANINEYVLGLQPEPDRWKWNWFTHGWGDEEELLSLIRWMREHNMDRGREQKIRFYGIDISLGGIRPETSIEAALGYLNKVDPDYSASARKVFTPLLEHFGSPGGAASYGVSLQKYSRLSQEFRDAYTSAIADLVAHIERSQLDYVSRSSKERYQWAHRHAVVARQMNNGFRAVASNGELDDPFKGPKSARRNRERSMFDNLMWALEQEGQDGRIAVWAHNGHIQRTPDEAVSGVSLGQYVSSELKDKYVSIGFAYRQGEGSGWDEYQAEVLNPAKPGSLDAALALVGQEMFILNLRDAPKSGPIHEALDRRWEQKNFAYTRRNPLHAWDALFYIDKISYVRTK